MNIELTDVSLAKDYEIDILIGKLAAIYLVFLGCLRIFHRVTVSNKPFEPLVDIIFCSMWILIPCIFLFSLQAHKVRLSRWTLRIWFFWFMIMCWSITDRFLNKPSGFWKGIFPLALITACMIIGEVGVVRVKGSGEPSWNIAKIPKIYRNTHVLVGSLGTIIMFVSTFTMTVFAGKHVSDFAILNWPSLEQNRVFLFYAGIAISFFPCYFLGALISSILTMIFERIWKLFYKENFKNG